MIIFKTLCTVLLIVSSCILVECRSYNTGLIFYNLENHNTYLPPTISVSRGRGLTKFKYSPRGSIWSTFGKPCDCVDSLCGCCVGIKVKQYNFDQKLCANVSYALPKDEIQLEVSFNDTATAKYGIAARNPSPLCVPIMMGIPMSMCIQMSNIGVQGDNLNMCMDFLVRLASTELFEMHFQCMKVGLQGASWVGSDGQPVIPANEGKIKDQNTYESDEYYDESEGEQESQIISEEENIVTGTEAEELNKAQEEMDNNDITEKVMDIVKEKEEAASKESTESAKENEVESLSLALDHKQVGEIVTNIMDSINGANAAYEVDTLMEAPVEMDASASEIKGTKESSVLDDIENYEENLVSKEAEENKLESMEKNIEINALKDPNSETETIKNNLNENIMENFKGTNEIAEESLENVLESLEHEVNDVKEVHVNLSEMKENNENIKDHEDSDNVSNSTSQVDLHLEELLENPQNNEMMNNTVYTTASEKMPIHIVETGLHNKNQPEKELEEAAYQKTTTEHMSDDTESASIENVKMVMNSNGERETTARSKTDHELSSSLETLQHSIGTTTENLLSDNLKPTMPHDALTTSEIGSSGTTTATLITTTSNKPSKLDKISAVAATFIEHTNGVDKNTNNDDDRDEVNESGDGDNSHEDDSDYADEESEETEDETTEINNASGIVMPTPVKFNSKNGISHKESLTTQELSNESNSNESYSNDETNENTSDEEVEVEENADIEDHNELNEQHTKVAEEKYDGQYEHYETTVVTNNQKVNSDKNTCCKSSIAFVLNNSLATTMQQFNDNNNNGENPQTDTTPSNNLPLVSNRNFTISNTDVDNMLSVKSSTNKMSEMIAGSAAATLAPATTTTSSNVMPLPLARKLFSLHHQQQQQQHRRL